MMSAIFLYLVNIYRQIRRHRRAGAETVYTWAVTFRDSRTKQNPIRYNVNIASSLTVIEGRYPGCGILITGDFNRLNVSRLLKQFKLKQLVRGPTRGERTLDLIITNMPQLYDKNLLQSFTPFGLSDHSVLLLQPKTRTAQSCSRRSVTRRDTRLSRRHELGRYLSSTDWSFLDSVTGCESKLQLFLDLVKTGLDTIMPLKPVKLHVNDAPWITPEFKNLIKLRQKAYTQGNQDRFRP